MTREQGRRVVLGTFFLVLVLISMDEIYTQKRVPNPQRYIAALVAWFILGIVAEVEPSVGGGLALLATAGMVLTRGKVFDKLPYAAVSVSSNGRGGIGKAGGKELK